MKYGTILFIAEIVLIVARASYWAQNAMFCDEVTPIPVRGETRNRTRKDQKTEDLMVAKLGSAEQILDGLVRHDFQKISKAAESLKMVSLRHPSRDSEVTGDKDVYEHFRMEFMRLAARLEAEANDRNLAGAAYFQQSLTATCIGCHDYMRHEELKSR